MLAKLPPRREVWGICPLCQEEIVPANGSKLRDGTPFHVRCPAREPEAAPSASKPASLRALKPLSTLGAAMPSVRVAQAAKLAALPKLASLQPAQDEDSEVQSDVDEGDLAGRRKRATRAAKSGGKSTGNDNFLSPPDLMEFIRGFRPIGLDPCGSACQGGSFVEAHREYLIEHKQDGLVLPWTTNPGHIVYFNPPYSQKKLWVRKADQAIREDRNGGILSLIAARTETVDVQDSTAKAVCFIRGRLVFVDPETHKPPVDANGKPTGAMFPSMIMYWGDEVDEFIAYFSKIGKTVRWSS